MQPSSEQSALRPSLLSQSGLSARPAGLAASRYRGQCRKYASIFELIESCYRVRQSRSPIERQLRGRMQAHLVLRAHSIGRKRARGAAEDRFYGAGEGAAVGKIHLDALREERIGIRVAVFNDLKTVGESKRLRVSDCLGSEVFEADCAAAQADGADILQTQPSVAGRHYIPDRATNQPCSQRRDVETTRNDPLGAHRLFRHQALQAVYAAMCRTPARKRLAAEFGNAPSMAQLVEWRRIGHALEQGKIAEFPANRCTRTWRASSTELDCRNGAACGKAHLHSQLRRPFGMRLHRARTLPVINPDGVSQPRGIEPCQHRQADGGTES